MANIYQRGARASTLVDDDGLGLKQTVRRVADFDAGQTQGAPYEQVRAELQTMLQYHNTLHATTPETYLRMWVQMTAIP